MRVALVNPGNDLRKMFGMYAAAMTPVVPQGLCYVASSLERAGHTVRIDDQYATHEPVDALARRLVLWGARVVGVSVLTPAARWAENLSVALRQLDPGIFIIWGNIHARVFCDDVLNLGFADAVGHFEGELTTVDLVAALGEGRELHGVKGISWRDRHGDLHHNPARELVEDLDTLPYPAYHLLDIPRYIAPPMLSFMEPILAVQASRGCPFTCHYCTQENLPKGIRTRTMESVVDEIEYYHRRFQVKAVGFMDANFPYRKEQALEFAELFMKRGLHKKIFWITETRVDLIDDETMKALRAAGLRLIMYGFESGTQAMLDSYNKRVKLDSAMTAMQVAKRHGVAVLGLFMLGMPGETPESARETVAFAKKLDPDFAKFNLAVPYPGSEFFERWRGEHPGPLEWEKFSSWLDRSAAGELLYVPQTMTGEELMTIRDEGMRSFYLRPWFIARHIAKGTMQAPSVSRALGIFVVGRAREAARRRMGV